MKCPSPFCFCFNLIHQSFLHFLCGHYQFLRFLCLVSLWLHWTSYICSWISSIRKDMHNQRSHVSLLIIAGWDWYSRAYSSWNVKTGVYLILYTSCLLDFFLSNIMDDGLWLSCINDFRFRQRFRWKRPARRSGLWTQRYDHRRKLVSC